MLGCYVSQWSKQIIFAHLVGAEVWMETENTKYEQLKKKFMIRCEIPPEMWRLEAPPALWEAISQFREFRITLGRPSLKTLRNWRKIETGVERQVDIFMRYHYFLFSFNIAKISWLMYSHAGLYVSKCRANHVMWSPQISQAKLGWVNKTPQEETSKEHLYEIWSRAGESALKA